VARRKVVEKITARVFCRADLGRDCSGSGSDTGKKGGNPLTIFSSEASLPSEIRRRLARTCEWESAVVDRTLRRVSFHLPQNGDPVSFCAHAAMGAATELARVRTDRNATVSEPFEFETADDEKLKASVHQSHDDEENALVVSMEAVATPTKVEPVEHPPTLHRVLRDALGLQSADLVRRNVVDEATPLFMPTFLNASVMGRPKTLVGLKSLEKLQSVKPPTNPDAFRVACDALNSTGIYLYAHANVEGDHDASINTATSWECRQFPRFSGYPEDPATGVAAAALAVALHNENWNETNEKNSEFHFYQGTAMQRPSLIVIQNVQLKNDSLDGNGDDNNSRAGLTASFRILGRVEVDGRETIEVADEE